MATEEKGVMFDEFSEGQARLDDAIVTLKSNRFEKWDYRGNIPQPVLALHVQAVDGENATHDEYLSAGDLKFFVPSSDGTKAIPVGKADKLNKNTNAVAFLISILNSDKRGELAAKLKMGDVSVLDGSVVHVVQQAQPKRKGIDPPMAPGADGQVAATSPKTQLVVDKIITYPWEAAGATTAPAATAAAPAAAPAGNGAASDVNSDALGLLIQILSAEGGTIKKAAIAGKVFNHDDVKKMAAATRNAILGVIVKDDFLASGPWQYDKASGTVTLG